MKEEKDRPNRSADLRRRAEEIAHEKAAPIPENLDTLPPEVAQRLLHELQVHQIELEMQNEELRRTQAEIEASQARYFDLYDMAPVGYFTLSAQGLILEANLTAANMLGVGRSHLVRQPLTRFILREDQNIYYGHRKQLFETSVPQVCELRMLSANAAPFWVQMDATVVRGTGGAPLYRTVVSDISERKFAEAERIKLERQLQQAQKAESLGRMARAIAHHFNNKLMVVTGNLELALNDVGLHQELSTRLLQAHHATVQAAEVSTLMLAYLGQALPKAEPLDLAKVCREVTETQRSFMPKTVTLRMDIPPHGPTIKVNQVRARQILSNLIVNAWEAIGEGEGDIRVSLRIVKAEETSSLHIFPADWKPEGATYACLEVSDTGHGINPEQLDLIFDPFFSTRFTGRGLGLAVVLGSVRSFGGAIAVESKPGRGSLFRVFWPIAEQGAQPVRQAETEASRAIIGSGLVLFVDDEAQLCNLAEAMLGRLGFEVIKACHGLEALEIFRMRKDEVSLVILDLTMPGMNGWETLEALRALRPDIPVVLASGYDEAEAMEGKRAELPQAFLHKPYSMAELKAALGAAVEESSAESAKRH
jgi:two-component system, cell cycle sensor histidine kinase and response regulator CckA